MLYSVVLVLSAISRHISPSLLHHPTPIPSPRSSWNTELSPLCYITAAHWLCFMYGNVYVSVLRSQFILPCPSLTGSISWFSTSAHAVFHSSCTTLRSQQQRRMVPFAPYSLCMCSVAQSCPTLCDLMDCSPPGSSVHGILQARILEWVATPSFRGSSQPRG